MKNNFNNYKKNLLKQAVKMDGSINFQTCGDINIYPCPWESDKQVTSGKPVSYEGGIRVYPDGQTLVKRWKRGSKGPLYDTLYETAHGAVKMVRPHFEKGRRRLDKEAVIVTFRFPKKYGRSIIESVYRQEKEQVLAFIQSRKEETVWK